MNLAVYLLLIIFLIVLLPGTGAPDKKLIMPSAPLSLMQGAGTDSIPYRYSSKKCPLWKLGPCIIYEKDGSEIRNVLLKEIHDHWIVYEKNGSLHDFMIEKIDRIHIGNFYHSYIHFDSNKKPQIRTY